MTASDLDPAERTRCEVWTRVMGYHRPVSAFNNGKQSEHAERLNFREPENPGGYRDVWPNSRPCAIAFTLVAP